MKTYSITCCCLIAIACAVSACARMPPLTPQARLPVADVVRHVDCEMVNAFYKNPKAYPAWFHPDEWSVSASLTLKADSEIDASFGYDHKYTKNPLHVWDLGLGAGLDQGGHRDTSVSYSGKLMDLKPLVDECRQPIAVASFGGHPLTGDLGIASWRDRMIGHYDGFAKPTALSYANEFKLTISGSVSPVLTLKVATDTPKGNGSLSNDDTISLAFARIQEPEPPAPIVIKITQLTNKTQSEQNPPPGGAAGAPPPSYSVTVSPGKTAAKTGNGVNAATQRQLDQIQNQGIIIRNLPDCQSRNLC